MEVSSETHDMYVLPYISFILLKNLPFAFLPIGPGVLARKQIPLKLAWATTVHKSQGSTLTRAILDISSCFEVGQAYVSLSRVKSINGLYLEKPVSMNNILVSERVLTYYKMADETNKNKEYNYDDR